MPLKQVQPNSRRPKPQRDWLMTIMIGMIVIGSAILVGIELPRFF